MDGRLHLPRLAAAAHAAWLGALLLAGTAGGAAAPAIAKFKPTSAPVGTTVTVTGSALTGATAVRFNGVGTTFSVVSPTQLTATVPANATSGPITVDTPGGTGTSAKAFKVMPKVTGFSPATGPRGASVGIDGASFAGATAVKFGSASASFTVDSSTHITATVPAKAVSGRITVTTPGGSSTSAGTFVVQLPPVISKFTPKAAPGGAQVTISGTDLDSVTRVTVNGVDVGPLTRAATRVTFAVPVNASSGPVAATGPGGTATTTASLVVLFSVTSISPASGAPGAPVTLRGVGFSTVSSVKFSGVAAGFQIESDAELLTHVPPGAASGPITLTSAFGVLPALPSFGVTAITGFAPPAGAAGAEVAIDGRHLSAVTAVKFGNLPASFEIDSDTRLTATVPAGAVDAPITVSTGPLGHASSAGPFGVITVSWYEPSIGSVHMGSVGDAVTITGTHLDFATGVAFTGDSTASLTKSPTTIHTTIPSLARTGPITVLTPHGNAVAAGDLAVVPKIDAVTPDRGPIGTAVTITGTGFAGVTALRFDGIFATAPSFTTNAAATEIRTTVPAGALPGPITVSVPSTLTAPAAGGASDTFHVLRLNDAAPRLALPGDEITLGGSSLDDVTSITFGGGITTTPTANVGGSLLRVTVPDGARTGHITVTGRYGTISTPNDFVVEGITGFDPPGGGAGTVVTITGVGFNETPVTNVAIGGAAASFSVDSDTQITATLPAFGFSRGEVTVFTPVGFSTLWSPYFEAETSIAGFEPASAAPGALVRIHGTNFRFNVTGVSFNGAPAGWVFDFGTQDLVASVPPGATTGPISIMTTSDGWLTTAADFTVAP